MVECEVVAHPTHGALAEKYLGRDMTPTGAHKIVDSVPPREALLAPNQLVAIQPLALQRKLKLLPTLLLQGREFASPL